MTTDPAADIQPEESTMPDVTIPADVAKAIADDLRRIIAPSNDEVRLSRKAWADLLDPQPPSLREQVAKAWCAEYYGEYSRSAKDPAPEHRDAADAVLAVVADAPIEQLIALVGPRFADWRDDALDVRHDPSATTDGGA